MSQTEVQLIKDAVIVNADISNSAAIDVSKISGAMPLSGGTFTNDVIFTGTNANIQFDKTADAIEFLDNAEARFGTGDDLKIFHNGSQNYIDSQSTQLRIETDALRLRSDSGETYLEADANGAVELYYDNARKFSTTADGGELLGGGSNNVYLNLKTSDNTVRGYVYANSSNKVGFLHEGGSWVAQFDRATDCFLTGNWLPDADNTYNLGSTSKRWKNVYTNDLNLSNEGHGNDVDGTWGSYTIQEGAEDLFLINKRTKKKYKFNLTEVA